ncbi:hypothetical protein E2562_026932 [Oryza meyeriana var. granulata]|uniref:Uncharacterized protein n=1 Tax=Oryza meyeriana var. granulata TaxID=110450 RepID=A0A6G1EZD4_9ORYZ|nr:hypothetical protein E2562_026932 [Oryza meyeriana var. granulata]
MAPASSRLPPCPASASARTARLPTSLGPASYSNASLRALRRLLHSSAATAARGKPRTKPLWLK